MMNRNVKRPNTMIWAHSKSMFCSSIFAQLEKDHFWNKFVELFWTSCLSGSREGGVRCPEVLLIFFYYSGWFVILDLSFGTRILSLLPLLLCTWTPLEENQKLRVLTFSTTNLFSLLSPVSSAGLNNTFRLPCSQDFATFFKYKSNTICSELANTVFLLSLSPFHPSLPPFDLPW